MRALHAPSLDVQAHSEMAQIDHLGQTRAKEIGGVGRLGHQQNSQKSASDTTILGDRQPMRTSENPVFMRVAGDLQGRLIATGIGITIRWGGVM